MGYTTLNTETELLIVLVGQARHGKDTAAKYLLKLFSDAERFAFSDAIAAVCRATLGMHERDPRLMQDIGMALRGPRPEIWNSALYGAILDRGPKVAIVTGARFPNEMDCLRAIAPKMVVIRVRRFGISEQGSFDYVSPDRDPNHPAESQIEDIKTDYEIKASSVDALRWQLNDTVTLIKKELTDAGRR